MSSKKICKNYKKSYCIFREKCRYIHVPRHKKLVILDVNGILLSRKYITSESNLVVDSPLLNTKINNFQVFQRPNLCEFIDYILANFDVAIWTSAKYSNAMPALTWALGIKRTRQFQFIWTQKQCVATEKSDIRFTKPIEQVFAALPQYKPEDTLILDDTRDKYTRSDCTYDIPDYKDRVTIIEPPIWSYENINDSELNGTLRQIFESHLNV